MVGSTRWQKVKVIGSKVKSENALLPINQVHMYYYYYILLLLLILLVLLVKLIKSNITDTRVVLVHFTTYYYQPVTQRRSLP